MADEYKRIRDFIRDEMNERKMTYRDFASLVGVSHPTISRIVNGQLDPSLEVLRKLAKGTGVRISTLLDLIDTNGHQSARAQNELLAFQLSKLTEEQRLMVLNLIRGFLVSEQFSDRP